MLFRPVLPLLRAKHCHFLLPPSCSWCHHSLLSQLPHFPSLRILLHPVTFFHLHLASPPLSFSGPPWRLPKKVLSRSGIRWAAHTWQFRVQTYMLGLSRRLILGFWLCWLFHWQTLALKVSIHCEGCKKKVKKVLHSIEGTCYSVSQSLQAVLFSESDLKDLKNEENLN